MLPARDAKWGTLARIRFGLSRRGGTDLALKVSHRAIFDDAVNVEEAIYLFYLSSGAQSSTFPFAVPIIGGPTVPVAKQ